jgi:gliding motility-associated-like protein
MMDYKILVLLFLTACTLHAQNPNDCTNSINLCGDTDLDITPSGIGEYEFNNPNNPAPGCYNFRADQVWFRVEMETTGTFSFELNPDQPQADYDFAVFGPTTSCDNLGPAIRCSSTNPDAAGVTGDTGLNDTETDLSEGPGAAGNGFLRELDVNAGEVYYIIIGLAAGGGGFTMNTSGSANLPPPPVINDIEDLEACDDVGAQDGIASFDFTQLNIDLIGTEPNTVVSYYETENDANLGSNEISFPYTNTSPNQTIYVRAERTDSECVNFSEFNLDVDDSNIDFTADTIYECSENTQEQIDLANYEQDIFSNATAFNITYYNNLSDATAGINAQPSLREFTLTPQEVFLRFQDPTGVACEFFVAVPYQLANPPELAIPPDIDSLCDDDFDELLEVSLIDQNASILNGLDPVEHEIRYYRNAQDRQNGSNNINSIQVDATIQQVFVEVQNTRTGCSSQIEFNTQLNLRPVLAPQDPQIYCLNATQPLILEVESGFAFYEWSNGDQGANAFTTPVDAPGDYTVTVTNTAGCTSELTIVVNPSDVAVIEDIEIDNFNNGNNTAQIISSGPGDYEFQVDDTGFQDSNSFGELYRGFHTLRVRDKNGCGVITQEFVVLDYEQFFTPNGDGFNDVWTLEGISEFPEAVLTIFDRYGRFIYRFTAQGNGWDGTLNGEPLPSSTYWFTLTVPDKPVTKGYFALKR